MGTARRTRDRRFKVQTAIGKVVASVFWDSDALQGRRFADDDDLKRRVYQKIRRFSTEFYATGIECLMHRWKKCVDKEGDY
jgi:hypothetical protein